MRQLYTVLFYVALPFFLLRLIWRSRQHVAYRQRWAERFGICPFQLEKSLWIHTVSVGETLAAIPLIKKLKAQFPAIAIVVTTMTVTGSARVVSAFADSVYHAYIPYDIPLAIRRFLQRTRPLIFVCLETELWPNLYFACHSHNIPIVVANARLSAQSAAGYQRVKKAIQPLLAAITTLAAQSEADAQRFLALGMAPHRVIVTGNLKFDLELPADLSSACLHLRGILGRDRPIWVAASTHPGEEDIILDAHRMIKTRYPQALLVLVPRHPERFAAVAALIRQKGFQLNRRSEPSVSFLPSTEVYLGDTMGELLILYAVADIAFVGGSLLPVGGHNMLEPAALHKPILTGQHVFNFAQINALLLAAKAIMTVTNAKELAARVSQLFADPSARQQMGADAYRIVEANRGSLAKHCAMISALLPVSTETACERST